MKKGLLLLTGSLLCFSLIGCSKNIEKKETIKNYTKQDIIKNIDYDVSKYITLPKDYKQVKLDRKLKGNTEEEYNQYLDEYLKGYPNYIKTKKEQIEKSDTVRISYTEDFDGTITTEHIKFITISDKEEPLINNVQEKLIGKKVGDSFVLETDYDGSKVKYSGIIDGIYKKEKMTHKKLTEEYIKIYNIEDENDNIRNLNDFHKYMKEDYKEECEYENNEIVNEFMIDYLKKNAKFNLSDDILDKEEDILEKEAENYGLTLEEYIDMYEEDELKYDLKELTKEDLIKDAILMDSNISVTKKELEKHLELYEGLGEEKELILNYAKNKAWNNLMGEIKKTTP